MGIRDTQDEGNDRWFGAVQYTCAKTIAEEFGRAHEGQTCLTFAMAGVKLAKDLVERLQTLRTPWGDGDLEKAIRLSNFCILIMISRWYRFLAEKLDQKEEERQTAARGAWQMWMTLTGSDSEKEMVQFVNMDTQFNIECDYSSGKVEVLDKFSLHNLEPYWGNILQYPIAFELEKQQYQYILDLQKFQMEAMAALQIKLAKVPGITPWEYTLAIDLELQALGQEPFIDWQHQTFPVTRHEELAFRKESAKFPPTMINDFSIWLASVVEAQKFMFEYYRTIEKELT